MDEAVLWAPNTLLCDCLPRRDPSWKWVPQHFLTACVPLFPFPLSQQCRRITPGHLLPWALSWDKQVLLQGRTSQAVCLRSHRTTLSWFEVCGQRPFNLSQDQPVWLFPSLLHRAPHLQLPQPSPCSPPVLRCHNTPTAGTAPAPVTLPLVSSTIRN